MIGMEDDDEAREEIQVFIRVRPTISEESKYGRVVNVSAGQVVSVKFDKYDTTCKYNRVFDERSSQSDVFDSVKPLLSSVLNGFNACVFAYGQTSAGKSHTMLGPGGGTQSIQKTNKSDLGLIPRAVEYIFNSMSKQADDGYLSYNVKASFVQIYNENLFDLLKNTKEGSGEEKFGGLASTGRVSDELLKIREIPKSGGSGASQQYEVYISGLSEFRVQTADDVLRLLESGTKNRCTKSTDYNDTSSRSHAILQLSFELEKQIESGQTMLIRSKLSFADLAGNEKMSTSESLSDSRHLKEMTSINQSLSTLGNVISALSSKKPHVPYRESKLTRILQDSLGGNTRTIVIACVAPTQLHIQETMSTLQFADRAKSVMLRVKANTVTDDKDRLVKAYAEIARLKTMLREALSRNSEGASNRARDGRIETRAEGRTDLESSSESVHNGYAPSRSNSVSYHTTSLRSNPDGAAVDTFDKHSELINSMTLQIFEENERIKGENTKLCRALEWSIKLARKKKAESMEFDNASADEIMQYKHILNSIKLSHQAISASTPHSQLGKRENVRAEDPSDPYGRISAARQGASRGNSRRPSVVGGPIPAPGPGTGPKPRTRGKSASLPQLFRSQKEMDYIQYLSSAERQVQQDMPRTPEMVYSLSQMLQDKPAGGIRARASSISKPLNLEMEKHDIYAPQETTDSDSECEKERENQGNSFSLPSIGVGASASRTNSPTNGRSERTSERTSERSSGRISERTSELLSERSSGHSTDYNNGLYTSKSYEGSGMTTGAEHRIPFQMSKGPDVSPTAMGNMMQSVNISPPGLAQSRTSEPPPQMLPPDLSYTMDDVGMVIEMFSFRYDCWGAMTITDFDPSRGVHKCRLGDGTVQLLDLKKKPIRAAPLRIDNE